ncbi:acyltransferase family protein [Methylobacterium sp. WL9]|uniref:acyltransferase family protein n=1 Tax=Methylobacterium sp. WL9 TaxID=2603898 RepID=UPI00164FE48A|nr:acyltransferase family protein [Methylobacterium sp. WL9]
MTHRLDLNALRAIAVAGVVAFHLKINLLSGGFSGVDVFFVLSGFLMTKIIADGIEGRKFSFARFYAARVRRIVPGLLATCSAVLIFGYFWVDPIKYEEMARSAVYSLLFVSNINLWKQVGYFDIGANEKWFLHTWSLSVEWQFYLLYPPAMYLLYRVFRTRRRVGTSIKIAILLSFALSVVLAGVRPASAFFLLPTRAWEMLAGGAVALSPIDLPQRFKRPFGLIGLCLIGASFLIYDSLTPWPSFGCLLPVVGAVMVIAARDDGLPLYRNPAVIWTGLWSYGIYLAHWPVIVGVEYLALPWPAVTSFCLIAAIMAGCTLLAHLASAESIRRLWEAKIGTYGRVAFGAAFLLVGTSAAGIALTNGGEWRQPENLEVFRASRLAMGDWDYPSGTCNGLSFSEELRPCHVGARRGRRTLIIGDSFAQQLFSRAREISDNDPTRGFTFVTSAGCPPIVNINRTGVGFRCDTFIDKALKYAESSDFDHVMFVSMWYNYFKIESKNVCFIGKNGCAVARTSEEVLPLLGGALDAMEVRLRQIRAGGKSLTVVLPFPYSKVDVPSVLVKNTFLGRAAQGVNDIEIDVLFEDYDAIRAKLKGLADNVGATLLDPMEFLCVERHCPTLDGKGIPYYRDSSHLRSSTIRSDRFVFLDKFM